MATRTLCPSASPRSKDAKRKLSRFTSSSRAQSLAMAKFVPTKMLIMAMSTMQMMTTATLTAMIMMTAMMSTVGVLAQWAQ